MEPIILHRISDQKPLVSVVSITYNHEPYIRDCLEGFMLQKTDFPVEVIVHDDASTDHTADIMREYYEKRPDLFHIIIQRVNHKYRNAPVQAPLFEMAQGKYIALCEGDDYWTDPLKLQKQFDFMESHPDCSLCFHNSIIRDEMKKNRKKIQYKGQCDRYYSLRDVIALGGDLMTTASMFFRTEGIQCLGKIRNGCPVGDYPLAIYMATRGNCFYSKEIMSTYRVNAIGSWSRNNIMARKRSFYEEMTKWLQNNKETMKEDQAIDYIISRYYFEMYSVFKEGKELMSNIYCRKMYNRLHLKDKIAWLIWGYTLFVFKKTQERNFVFRVWRRLLFARVMNNDVWQ